ncbi:unnamed protein product [Rotaria socialis]|uniref:F-box domain-containing protein n=1 Tax=Rotaria socialis TaxID=392032 RepID=A0A817MW28_9BILA|nr:unnamed protein product [Rotaria socialis]CAF3209541.1 unnamed protein product [Rotaria socialis]CAF3448895.1 unnamed protein product [Rotaria socialis]
MVRSDVHLLDLPNEILLIIFRKLNNVDVLYSLSDINNERLAILAQDKIFTNILNFVSALTDDIYLIPASILDRFCSDILPRVHHNVKCLILDSTSMEKILLVADYPYLNQLKLVNFNQDICSGYFTDESSFQHISRQQITDLSLICNEDISNISVKTYAKNVYIHLFTFFKNLTHLSIVGLSRDQCQPLSLSDLPSTTFSSSTLTKLCISLNTLQDCLSLLDGRLKQLSTFIVSVHGRENHPTFGHNMDDLPNLKCFSLTYNFIKVYDAQVIPLLRRMSHLKELTLYLSIENRAVFVDGTHLYNKILIHMPQLRTFTFYIRTEIDVDNSVHWLSSNDIQQTFNKLQWQQVACIVNYSCGTGICHVFSLPFSFDRLDYIGNTFPHITFNRVTFLKVLDSVHLKH